MTAPQRQHAMQLIKTILDEAIHNITLMRPLSPSIQAIAEAIAITLRGGGKLLVFGNGGSAADADHIAAEFVGRFACERQPLPAIALTTSPAVITALSNDYTFELVFARQIEGLAKAGDSVIGISTSGKSANVVKALQTAHQLNLTTIGFTGQSPCPMDRFCRLCFKAPSMNTPRIQEMHMLALHTICEIAEADVTRPT